MPENGADTDTMLNLAAGGDSEAVHSLMERHRADLARMVSVRMDPRVRGRIDPSDVIQETLTLASQRLSQYVAERPLPFYPWLRQIAWEALLKEHRRHVYAAKRSVAREQRSRPKLSDASVHGLAQQIVGSVESPSGAAMRTEMSQRLRRALDALRESDQEVIILRYLEHMSSRDIGAVLGISEAAVNMRMMGAIERIRKVLLREQWEH